MFPIPVSAPLAFFSAMRAPAQARSAGGDKHAPHAPRLPVTQVSNAMPSPDAGAHSGSGTRSATCSAASPPSGGKADFRRLAEARGWPLASGSTDGLKALRQQVLAAAVPAAPVGARPTLPTWILEACTEMYHSEMTRFLSEGHYAPDVLHAIHQELRDSLLVEAGMLITDPQPEHLDPLGRDMDVAYASYKRDNTAKLKSLQTNISKEHKGAVSSYMKEIETALARATTLEALEREHRRIQGSAQKGLREAIHRRIGADEPVEFHQKALDAEIDEYWRNTVAPRAKDALDVPGSAAPGGL